MKSQVPRIAKKVFVGMSGGVDSSVSAALLKQAGYDVIGVFIKVWQPDWIECTWRDERREAMRAAAHLGIPFITLDLEKEYKEGVIDYMIAEYSTGRTPNPDVMCNREVKFGAFWRWAKEQGANYVATGHYARIVTSSKEQETSKAHLVPCTLHLETGVDSNKDQSYFLWTLNQDDLKHILFPVGHLEKPAVRALAKKFKLPNAEKKDSQGLCFIGKIDVKDFLAHYIKTEKGNVLNEKGEVIGSHNGALLITIGERHGFTIDAKHKTPHDERYYVVSKDVESNTITVSDKAISHDQVTITNDQVKQQVQIMRVNWTSSVPARGSLLQARTRYRQQLQDIEIISIDVKNNSAIVEFKTYQDTITPGQSLVVYNSAECMGGGLISGVV
ncbi:MAG TPA: tRNA 2-thiouridine(34) synthase MnmA [Candidatus Paceibacterota bacterium]|jgi:tRNA-specific 2-thiouridylase|nr:tRNA 2-thiouridine(34) synthase MnmA [Candidatus Paceibacterota bacterium]